MGFVANFIFAFQQCKNFKNRLRFDKITESLKVGTFFETQCINRPASQSTDDIIEPTAITKVGFTCHKGRNGLVDCCTTKVRQTPSLSQTDIGTPMPTGRGH